MPKLKAPAGAAEANFGTERFRVDNNGEVDVPDEAVSDLVHVGGFTLEAEAPAVPDGLVPVRHPDGVGCSVGGQDYEPNKDGVVFVPAAAVADLCAHGFAGVEV